MNAILLAGGKSSRYGSDKALINLQGELMIKRIFTLLKQVFEDIYVISNQEKDYSFLKGAILVEDIIANKGPLGGLYTGLNFSTSSFNFVTGCDMPFLSLDYLKLLVKVKNNSAQVIVPRFNGYLEPLAGIYHLSCLPAIKESLKQDKLKIKAFFPQVKVQTIDEAEIRTIGNPARLFYNINYKQDLKSAFLNYPEAQ